MRNTCIFLFIFCAIFFSSLQSMGQQQPISGSFKQLRFEQFADSIEQKSSYHFYFNPADVDSFFVDITVDKKTLNEVLQLVFAKTEFHFAIDAKNNVFITKRIEIYTQLPTENLATKSAAELSRESVTNADEEKILAKGQALENKLIEIGVKDGNTKGSARITGYVFDAITGEPMLGASIAADNQNSGGVTDKFGYYTLEIPKGLHTLRISSVGMKDTRRQVAVNGDGKLNIELQNFIPSLKAVVIVGNKNSNVKSLQMGVQTINFKALKQTPMAFGEADVMKVVLTLPGVTSVGEASTGLNVRGGASDQNLVLFNNSTIYNPSHLFGFFSAFNPDMIQDIQLYKSSIPEKYGGRLSSVLDVSTRTGNKKKFSGSGGIGPLTARLTLEGPISKKTTFIFGARSSYSDWIFNKIQNKEFANSKASFYDFALNVTHEINAKNSLYLTGYLSNDQFKLNSDTLYKYSNQNIGLKWKHIFNNKLVGIFSGGYDSYFYNVTSHHNPVNGFELAFDVKQTYLKGDFTYSPNDKHTISFGATSIYYHLNPGSLKPLGDLSLVVPNIVRSEQGLESAVYIGDRFDINPDFSISGGLRYSLYNYLGPQSVNVYPKGEPRNPFNVIDTINYSSGSNVKTYMGPEVRLSARYNLGATSSVKLSFNTLRQYIHMLSNSVTMSPTDIWKLSDQYIQPQTGQQYSIGWYKNFKSNTIETSVEVYYKNIQHFLDYKSGAKLLLNEHIETDVINTTGKAYGIEFMVQKKTGKLNGWINYTFSRSLVKMDDPIAGEVVNKGEFYPTNYDKPNVANLVGNYKFSHRVSVSLNVAYSTGRPITLPLAQYDLAGSQRLYYSDRNQYRIPDYFRMDLSMNIEGSHKVNLKIHGSFSFGVYNLTARKNAYSVYYSASNGIINGYKLTIFGTAIPFVTYNFKF